jgi:hypothetical protein
MDNFLGKRTFAFPRRTGAFFLQTLFVRDGAVYDGTVVTSPRTNYILGGMLEPLGLF